MIVCEMCFRDRSIGQLCMKHVSEIGVLIQGYSFVPSPLVDSIVPFLLIRWMGLCPSFPYPSISSLLLPPTILQHVFPLLILRSGWLG